MNWIMPFFTEIILDKIVPDADVMDAILAKNDTIPDLKLIKEEYFRPGLAGKLAGDILNSRDRTLLMEIASFCEAPSG